ncbi:hypothetical protein NC797_01345 [Aquibacillus sp. 3ASR75-11]|uniref:Uncharacterized protein n=1 Tax=Terrihalobacillus insolitus TaxID=2950438 RepID=A0A9X3WNR4_9BACI|nr:hypothetical protein [Terrihalobacillus insolitus]MDC3412155.1 hypothetical protein [Terrihalobacillus insolitus]MDC3423152.1 hypothetical protein [Terrihalobacillus insolitus]
MIKVKFLSPSQIETYFQDDVNEQFLQGRLQAYEKNRSSIPFYVEEVNGSYFLYNGFKFMDAMKRSEQNKPIPCYVLTKKRSELKRLLHLLWQGTHCEATNWKFKYKLIKQLTEKFQLTPSEIAAFLQINEREISVYLVEEHVPDYFKKKAIQTHTTQLVNRISSIGVIPESHKKELYQLAVDQQLTHKQLNWTLSFYYTNFYGAYSNPPTTI